MDNKSKQDGRDDAKVDLNDAGEIAYAAEKAGVSTEEYKRLAKESGSTSRKTIAEYIAKSNATS
jgi:hypothetical protein